MEIDIDKMYGYIAISLKDWRDMTQNLRSYRDALRHIQEMAEEDIRLDLGGAYLHQIEADARAALGGVV